ncbi:MAG: glycerate kinase family protein [Armatimonadota bacterium]
MRIIVCPDSFKGSLTSVEAAEAIARGIRIGAGEENVEIVSIPLADGGEGTVEAMIRATGGFIRRVKVHDPLGREIDSFYGVLGDDRIAVVEAAAASGLTLLAESERNPMITSSYGTGELMLAAANEGVKKIIVGIGGSATNDAGCGAMKALGVRFLDKNGNELLDGGGSLAELDSIDTSGLKIPHNKIEMIAACDVTNPLYGPNGSAAVFAPQKGATIEMIDRLDQGLRRWSEVVKTRLGKDVANLPGAGAAGGLSAALAAFLDAKLVSGIDVVLDAVGFDKYLEDADLIITGEGRLDEQTGYGKAVGGVLRRASTARIPVVALAGSCAGDLRNLYDAGLTAAFSIVPGPMTIRYAMSHAYELLMSLAANVSRLAKVALTNRY